MGTSKQVLEQSKELRAWWASIVEDPRFKQILVFARSEMMEQQMITAENFVGGRIYESILIDLPEATDPGKDLLEGIKPALLSHFEPKRQSVNDEKAVKAKPKSKAKT